MLKIMLLTSAMCLGVVGLKGETVFQKASSVSGTMFCAEATPYKVISVADAALSSPGYTPCSPSSVGCAWSCREDANCAGFNYNYTSDECQLFSSTPLIFQTSTDCAFFQVNATKQDFILWCLIQHFSVCDVANTYIDWGAVWLLIRYAGLLCNSVSTLKVMNIITIQCTNCIWSCSMAAVLNLWVASPAGVFLGFSRGRLEPSWICGKSNTEHYFRDIN